MNTFILRLAVAVILLSHSIPGMINGRINSFGNDFLNEIGFAPFGVPLAWIIKLSHIACAICLLWGKLVKPAAVITIFILIAGIILVHGQEGWFVIGGGRNGAEYNVLLICVLVAIMFPQGWSRRRS